MQGTNPGRGNGRDGFTLMEIVLAVAILSVVTTITYLSFSTAVIAWRRGTALSESLHHGDFVMDQLVMGLRSTYFPETGRKATRYGFSHEDNGRGEDASDVISWVKLGSSLVGKQCSFAGTPHRVKFFVDEDDAGDSAARIKAWRLDGQPEDFDPDEDVEPVALSRYVIGFDCRTIAPDDVDDEGEIEWQEEWAYTNDLPLAVELTLYLAPVEADGDAVEIRRIVEIPVAFLCEPWVKTGTAAGVGP